MSGEDHRLTVAIPVGEKEAAVRRAVAELALTTGTPVTALSVEHDNLESRFLAATSEAQEYRTGGN